MKRFLSGLLFGTLAFGAPAVTFHKDVEPILQSRCQGCHRAGEIGPMELMTYRQARPWAKSIRETVVSGKMPPWFADKKHGHFSNDRTLSQREIDVLTAWVDGGAMEGNPGDAPQPREFVKGWSIDKPDVVLTMPSKFSIPAKATIDYQYIVVPTNFTEDRWVRVVEARPSNAGAVHHAVIFVRPSGNKWLRGEAKPGVPFAPPRVTPDGKKRDGDDIGGGGNEILTIYTPGNVPDNFGPDRAKLIPAGADLVFQMHYTTNGKAGDDQTAVGLIFATQPPKEKVLSVAVGDEDFTIPPGASNFAVSNKMELHNEGTLLSFFPHMHLRGKAFEMKFQQPGEPVQTLLKINKYDFNWQLTYRLEQPIKIRPGATIQATGWFDNSANNPHNPDPKAAVRFGEQSWEEMMFGFFDVAVSPTMTAKQFFKRAQHKKTD